MNTLSLAAALIVGTVFLYCFFKALFYILAYLAVIVIASVPLMFLLIGVAIGLRMNSPMGSVIIYVSFFLGAGFFILWIRSKTFKKVYEKLLPKRPADDIYKIDLTKLNKPPQEKK